jgi:hypothetical protein
MGEWLHDKWRGLRRHPSLNAFMVLAGMLLSCAVAVWLRSGKLTDSPSWAIYLALSAAIFGLFREVIVRFIWFPELEMRFKNEAPYCDDPYEIPPDQNSKPFPSIWFRPLVINRGTARAEKVEVMVTDVHGPEAAGNRQCFLNLGWSCSSGAPRQDRAVLVWDGLNPGVSRFVDLGKIYEPSARKKHFGYRENLLGKDGTLFSVLVEYQNTKGSHLLHEGDWQLTLLLSAANHKTLEYRADIHLTGQWIDGMDGMLDPKTGGVKVKLTANKRKWWQAQPR